MKGPRALLAVGVVVLAGAALVALLLAGGSGDDEEPQRTARARLTLERFRTPDTGTLELLISLQETRLNDPELTGGEKSVLLRCFDDRGAATIRTPTDWPLLEEAGYPLPHIHHPVAPEVLEDVRRCRLTGPGIDFEGRVPGPPPAASQ